MANENIEYLDIIERKFDRILDITNDLIVKFQFNEQLSEKDIKFINETFKLIE